VGPVWLNENGVAVAARGAALAGEVDVGDGREVITTLVAVGSARVGEGSLTAASEEGVDVLAGEVAVKSGLNGLAVGEGSGVLTVGEGVSATIKI
jgi:hypothetical protein